MKLKHNIFRCALQLIVLLVVLPSHAQNWQWAKRAGSHGDNVPFSIFNREGWRDMVLDGQGNIYAVGFFFSPATFNNSQVFGPQPPFLQFGKQDAFLVKYNSCGNTLWWRRMGGTGTDEATNVILDKKGNIIVIGYCANELSSAKHFGDGIHDTVIHVGANPNFLTRYDSSGKFIDVRQPDLTGVPFWDSQGNFLMINFLNGVRCDSALNPVATYTFGFTTPFYPSIQAIRMDAQDNIYMCGSFNNTVNIGPGTILLPTPSTIIPGINASNALVMKFSPSGNLLWHQRGSSSGGGEGFSGMAIDTSGKFLAVGGGVWNGSTLLNYSVNTGVGSVGNIFYLLDAATGTLVSASTGSANYQGNITPYMTDRDNNFLCRGMINGFLKWDTTTYSSVGIRHSCIGRFDVTGQFLGIKMLPKSGADYYESIAAMAINEQGEVYIAGSFGGVLDSLGTDVYPHGQQDGMLAKFGFSCGADSAVLTPLPPEALIAVAQNSLTNKLTWSDNSKTENGFELYAEGGQISTFSLIATLAANTTTYMHTQLQPSTDYCYKVRAVNYAGFSIFTNTACATTLAAPVVTTSLNESILADSEMFPNPVNSSGDVTIQLPVNEVVTIRLLSSVGTVIFTQKIRVEEAVNSVRFSAPSVPGLYLIDICSTDARWLGKLVVRD